ncbi:hypothetical protein TNCV_3947951 [Trichonephila clavipes]|nr:hypothetical protein TNCV_3947951 [Trichonephila clavipes]
MALRAKPIVSSTSEMQISQRSPVFTAPLTALLRSSPASRKGYEKISPPKDLSLGLDSCRYVIFSCMLLKSSPCHYDGSQVYDWMGLDEWNSWFKSQGRDSHRMQDIGDLNKF